MMDLTDAFALCGWALAACACVLRLLWFERLPGSLVKVIMMISLFAGLLNPISNSGLPLAAYLRGVGGDLSITLLALCVWSLSHRLAGVATMAKREQTILLAVISGAALLLYLTALGWGNWDAYRLGWGSWWFLAILFGICVMGAGLGLRVLPALIALALLSWSFGLMESTNLWDYLLDPWLSAYALGFVFIKCWQSAFRRIHNRSPH